MAAGCKTDAILIVLATASLRNLAEAESALRFGQCGSFPHTVKRRSSKKGIIFSRHPRSDGPRAASRKGARSPQSDADVGPAGSACRVEASPHIRKGQSDSGEGS